GPPRVLNPQLRRSATTPSRVKLAREPHWRRKTSMLWGHLRLASGRGWGRDRGASRPPPGRRARRLPGEEAQVMAGELLRRLLGELVAPRQDHAPHVVGDLAHLPLAVGSGAMLVGTR